MAFVDEFLRDVWEQRRLVAQYPPSTEVEVGDILEKVDGVWQRRGNLRDWGFNAETDSKPLTGPWSLVSEHGVTINGQLTGGTSGAVGVVTPVEGELKLEFKGSYGYLISLQGVTATTLRNIADIPESIPIWGWNDRWVIVTEVWRADHGTAILSGQENAKVTLKAAGGVTAGPLTLANLATGWEIGEDSQVQDSFTGQTDVTPIYRGRRMSFLDIILGRFAVAPNVSVEEGVALLGDTAYGRSLTTLLESPTGLESPVPMVVFDEFDPTS